MTIVGRSFRRRFVGGENRDDDRKVFGEIIRSYEAICEPYRGHYVGKSMIIAGAALTKPLSPAEREEVSQKALLTATEKPQEK